MLFKGVARKNLRGAESQEFEKYGGVLQGVKGPKFFIMIFYVFFHHFLSLVVIFNHFSSSFSYVFLSFLLVLVFNAPLRWTVTCQGGGGFQPRPPSPSYVLDYLQIFVTIRIRYANPPLTLPSRNKIKYVVHILPPPLQRMLLLCVQ